MVVYLHYIGKRWYTEEEFIKEGMRLNVQRLTSFTMARKLFKTRATIYYARYDEERRYAYVFAIGKVIGVGSTMPNLRKLCKGEGEVYEKEVRGCGTCYTKTLLMNKEEIEEILDHINEEEAKRYRWVVITGIEPYSCSLDNIIEYNTKRKQIIVKDIGFTRGFIKIGGIEDREREGEAYLLKVLKMHKLRDSDTYDDYKDRYVVDTSQYKSLDTWLGGVTP